MANFPRITFSTFSFEELLSTVSRADSLVTRHEMKCEVCFKTRFQFPAPYPKMSACDRCNLAWWCSLACKKGLQGSAYILPLRRPSNNCYLEPRCYRLCRFAQDVRPTQDYIRDAQHPDEIHPTFTNERLGRLRTLCQSRAEHLHQLGCCHNPIFSSSFDCNPGCYYHGPRRVVVTHDDTLRTRRYYPWP